MQVPKGTRFSSPCCKTTTAPGSTAFTCQRACCDCKNETQDYSAKRCWYPLSGEGAARICSAYPCNGRDCQYGLCNSAATTTVQKSGVANPAAEDEVDARALEVLGRVHGDGAVEGAQDVVVAVNLADADM